MKTSKMLPVLDCFEGSGLFWMSLQLVREFELDKLIFESLLSLELRYLPLKFQQRLVQ